MQSTRITARLVLGAAIAFAVAAFVACSDDATPPPAASALDGGDRDGASSAADGGTTDDDGATTDGGSLEPTGKTSIAAMLGGVTHTLDRAQFGDETDDAGVKRAYVEAHLGGDPACPSADPDASAAAQPDYTMVVSGVPLGDVGESFTEADGVGSAYFDFKGDQLTAKPLTKATKVIATIVAKDAQKIELEVSATYAEGTASGRIAASYCASLSL